MKKFIAAALLASATFTPLYAKNVCTVKPGEKWLSIPAAKAKAAAAGYTNIRMGVEAGCYEAEAKKGGQDYEIYIHPVSGKIVMVRKDVD
jgi:hypothetical protein